MDESIVVKLSQQLDSSIVKTRRAPGGGVVPYISGEKAIEIANRVFNFEWSSDVQEIRFVACDERAELRWNPQTQRREDTGERKTTGIYYAIVRVSAAGITKSDVGRCICEGNTAEAHDMAVAGAVTDGLKRALRQFGDQFGNSLYDKEGDDFKEAMRGGVAAPAPKPAPQSPPKQSTLAPSPKPAPAKSGAGDPPQVKTAKELLEVAQTMTNGKYTTLQEIQRALDINAWPKPDAQVYGKFLSRLVDQASAGGN